MKIIFLNYKNKHNFDFTYVSVINRKDGNSFRHLCTYIYIYIYCSEVATAL